MRFLKMQKSVAKYLIKPVVYEEFWGCFRKMPCKSMQKALPLQIKVIITFPLLQNAENRYKPKGKQAFPKCKKALQKTL